MYVRAHTTFSVPVLTYVQPGAGSYRTLVLPSSSKVRPLSPETAEPNLALARNHVRITPLARLGIVYQIEPQRPPLGNITIIPTAQPTAPLRPLEVIQGGPENDVRGPLQVNATLGQGLYLDSIVMGGIDGEALPVTVDGLAGSLAVAAEMAAHAPGGALDVSA